MVCKTPIFQRSLNIPHPPSRLNRAGLFQESTWAHLPPVMNFTLTWMWSSVHNWLFQDLVFASTRRWSICHWLCGFRGKYGAPLLVPQSDFPLISTWFHLLFYRNQTLSQTINVCFPPSGLQSAILGVLCANRRLNRRTKNVSDRGWLRWMIYLLTATGVETENCAAAHLIQRLGSHPQVCDWTFILLQKRISGGKFTPTRIVKATYHLSL